MSQPGQVNPRAGAHRDHFVLAEPAVIHEYDVLGERDGRWVQVAQAITSLEQVRATIADFR